MLPFFHPTSVLVVDDDQLFLDSFEYRYGSALRCQTEVNPQVAVERLHQNNAAWKQHLNFIERASGEASRDHVFQLRRRPLQSLVNDPRRAEAFAVVIVDYSMPGMSGLDFCRAVNSAPAHKIMLTGQAGESTAIRAFNEGLIDCFLTKQDADLSRRLTSEVQRLTQKFFQDETASLGPIMDPVGRVFQNEALARQVEERLQSLGAVEYYFWDEPPGLLAIDAAGMQSMIVLLDEEGMRAQLEIAEHCDAPAPMISEFRQRTRIGWFPTPQGYFETSYSADWNHYVATAHEIDPNRLWMSTFKLVGTSMAPIR